MGALAITNQKKNVVGVSRTVIADVAFSSSYATGGDTYTAADLGLSKVNMIIPVPNQLQVEIVPDITNSKLILYVEGAAVFAQAANASNQSAITAKVMFIGDNLY